MVVVKSTLEMDTANVSTGDAAQRRIDRIHRNALRAAAIASGEFPDPSGIWRARAVASLMADRAMVSAHLSTVAEQIARSPLVVQPELVAQVMRPLTLAVEQAHLAIARLNAARIESSQS